MKNTVRFGESQGGSGPGMCHVPHMWVHSPTQKLQGFVLFCFVFFQTLKTLGDRNQAGVGQCGAPQPCLDTPLFLGGPWSPLFRRQECLSNLFAWRFVSSCGRRSGWMSAGSSPAAVTKFRKCLAEKGTDQVIELVSDT